MMFAFTGIVFLTSNANAYAEESCDLGSRIYFELPFKGEVKYTDTGARLPRELVSTSGSMSICSVSESSNVFSQISTFLDKAISDDDSEMQLFALADSYSLKRVFYIGDEVIAFVSLAMPNGPEIPFAARLTKKSRNEFIVSKLPANRNLDTVLKYLLTYNKPVVKDVDSVAISVSEPESNSVLLHVNVIFPEADHAILDKLEDVNKMIDDEDYSNYFGLLDSRSLTKSKEYLDSIEPNMKDQSAKLAFSIPVVEYIIDIDPIYFIAYKNTISSSVGKGKYQKPSGVRFQTFYGSGGDAKPWNLYYKNAFTHLMSSNGLFNEISVLKNDQ